MYHKVGRVSYAQMHMQYDFGFPTEYYYVFDMHAFKMAFLLEYHSFHELNFIFLLQSNPFTVHFSHAKSFANYYYYLNRVVCIVNAFHSFSMA